MSRYARIAFFLLLISLPIQLGKHFWPEFSFVQGIRIDYLSPIIYVSDLFFILLFLFSINKLKGKIFSIFKSQLGIVFIVTILIGSVFAVNMQASLYGVLKVAEFSYIALYISNEYKKSDIEVSLFVVTLGALVEVIISVFQFFLQRSLGGLMYYLGERTFTQSTPGIANFQFVNQEILRPYGTFPHPNVLAFYLLFVSIWLLFSLTFNNRILNYSKICALTLISLGIFLTFSRVIILLWILIIIFYVYKKTILISKHLKLMIFTALTLSIVLLFLFFFQRFQISFIKDSLLRYELFVVFIKMFFSHPLFGVGINNFFYSESLLQKTISPIFLQPVHNIYLLWICQTGLFGAIPLYFFIKNLGRNAINKLKADAGGFYSFAALSVFCVILAGLFDHYFLTLQQGQLITAIIIGFSYSKIKG